MLKKCTKKCAAREKFFLCRYSCVAVSHYTIWLNLYIIYLVCKTRPDEGLIILVGLFPRVQKIERGGK